jgi:hypothetical protein
MCLKWKSLPSYFKALSSNHSTTRKKGQFCHRTSYTKTNFSTWNNSQWLTNRKEQKHNYPNVSLKSFTETIFKNQQANQNITNSAWLTQMVSSQIILGTAHFPTIPNPLPTQTISCALFLRGWDVLCLDLALLYDMFSF